MPTPETPTDHLHRCWRQQFCPSCLDEASCSWCPFTQSCVPNTHPLPFLAPAYDEHICPHWSERWEIRTKPFGCNVSTVTSLSVVVSVLATLIVLGLGWGVVVVGRSRWLRGCWCSLRVWWRESRSRKLGWRDGEGIRPGFSRGMTDGGGGEGRTQEQEPLLGPGS
ncbi:hypothetical protein VTI74DRAFT_4690 [Chaetomium olivicolor]